MEFFIYEELMICDLKCQDYNGYQTLYIKSLHWFYIMKYLGYICPKRCSDKNWLELWIIAITWSVYFHPYLNLILYSS